MEVLVHEDSREKQANNNDQSQAISGSSVATRQRCEGKISWLSAPSSRIGSTERRSIRFGHSTIMGVEVDWVMSRRAM